MTINSEGITRNESTENKTQRVIKLNRKLKKSSDQNGRRASSFPAVAKSYVPSSNQEMELENRGGGSKMAAPMGRNVIIFIK